MQSGLQIKYIILCITFIFLNYSKLSNFYFVNCVVTAISLPALHLSTCYSTLSDECHFNQKAWRNLLI